MGYSPHALHGRAKDELKTRRVENFMDYALTRLMQASYYRVSDIGLQKSGIDLVLNDPSAKPGELKIMLVDEKFAVSYMHKDLQTYSFELSSENNKDDQGWFLSPDMKTTHYLLAWPQSLDEGRTIFSATVALVSKDAIKQWLTKKGIDPQKALEQMRSHFHGDDSVKHYPNCKYEVRSSNSGRPSKFNMTINGVRVVQSLNGKENPINILLPREELCRMATQTINVQSPIVVESVHQKILEENNIQYSIDDYMSAEDWERFEKHRNLPNGVTFLRDGCPLGKEAIQQLHDGDRLCIQTRHGRNVCLAVYGEYKQKWGITGASSQILGSDKSFSIPERIKDSLQAGGIPFGFVLTNATFSKQLKFIDWTQPQHGDSIVTFGDNTQNQVVRLRYNAYSNTFVLNDNKYVTPNDLPTFRGYKVISEKENNLKRAIADRLISCVPEIHRNDTLDLESLTGRIENVLKNNLLYNPNDDRRLSAEELALQHATPAECKALFYNLPYNKYPKSVHQFAQSLARDIVSLPRTERSEPGKISALLHDPERLGRIKAQYVQDRKNATRKAVDLGKALDKVIANKAVSFSKVVDVEVEAKEIKVPTHKVFRDSTQERISWCTAVFNQMSEHLQSKYDTTKGIVFTGRVPGWVMSAMASRMEGPVAIRTNSTTTVPIRKVPTANITESQGISFTVEKGEYATIIKWEKDPSVRITPEAMKNLQIPAIDPCKSVVIVPGKGESYITATLSATYKDMCKQVLCDNRALRGVMCVASDNKEDIGKYATGDVHLFKDYPFVYEVDVQRQNSEIDSRNHKDNVSRANPAAKFPFDKDFSSAVPQNSTAKNIRKQEPEHELALV